MNGNGNIVGRQSIENEGGNDNKLQSIVHGNGNGTGNVELLQSIVNGDEKNIAHKKQAKK